jgi:hypothetical protein
MANNRYYILCKCGERQYLGKSLGHGIYHTRTSSEEFLEEVYSFMWEHLMAEHPGLPVDEHLSPEWVSGTVFEIVTE